MDHDAPTDLTRHPLLLAAMFGKAAEVRRLLADGANVNEQVHPEGTALHVAIMHSDRGGADEVVEALLTAGASLDLRDGNWLGSPLHMAAGLGVIGIAEALISHGGDVNSQEDYQGRTPLHLAAVNGRDWMVEYLVSKGAEIDAVADCEPPGAAAARSFSDRGMTAIELAAREGHARVVKALLKGGASLGLRPAMALAMKSKQEHEAAFRDTIASFTETIAILQSKLEGSRDSTLGGTETESESPPPEPRREFPCAQTKLASSPQPSPPEEEREKHGSIGWFGGSKREGTSGRSNE